MRCLGSIDLAGAAIELWADDAESERHLGWFFGPTREPGRTAHHDLRVTVGVASSDRSSRTPDREDGPIAIWDGTAATSIRLRHETGRSAEADESTITVAAAPGADPWRSTRQLLFSALAWWFEQRSMVLLHAAAVARDGHAVIVTGPTGSGKSTCVAAAINAGWPVLSDDLVIVGRNGQAVSVWGVQKRITIDREIGDRLDLPMTAMPGDDRLRAMLTETATTPGWHPLRAVVTVGHDDADGRLERLEHVDALGALASAWTESVRPEALRRSFGDIAAIAGLPSFRLLHASDTATRLDRAATMLSVAWSSAGDTCTSPSDLHQ